MLIVAAELRAGIAFFALGPRGEAPGIVPVRGIVPGDVLAQVFTVAQVIVQTMIRIEWYAQ